MCSKISRRQFLKKLATGTGACCLSTVAPSLFGMKVMPAYAATSNQKFIAKLYLNGGVDTLFMFFPAIGALYDIRPTLNLTGSTGLDMGSNMLMNNNMPNLFTSWQNNEMALILKAGDLTSGHSKSHSDARNLWNQIPGSSVGVDAALTNQLAGSYCTSGSIFTGLDLTGGSTAFNAGQYNATANNFSNFAFSASGNQANQERSALYQAYSMLSDKSSDVTNAKAGLSVAKDAESTMANATSLSFANAYTNTTAGRLFRDFNRAVDTSGTCSKAVLGSIGGFDTHGGQASSLNARIADIDNAYGTFRSNLQSKAHPAGGTYWDHALVVLYSEFGRQPKENGNKGTDHGRGGSMVVCGGAVNGGIYGNSYIASDMTVNSSELPVEVDSQNALAPIFAYLGANPNSIFPNRNSANDLNIV